MTLREFVATLRNLEGVGANVGEFGGGDRRVVCWFDFCHLYIDDIEIEGGDVVLHLRDEE